MKFLQINAPKVVFNMLNFAPFLCQYPIGFNNWMSASEIFWPLRNFLTVFHFKLIALDFLVFFQTSICPVLNDAICFLVFV